MEMDQGLFDECTTAYRAERMKEKKVSFSSIFENYHFFAKIGITRTRKRMAQNSRPGNAEPGKRRASRL